MIFGFPAGMLGIMVDGGADGIPPSASFLDKGKLLGGQTSDVPSILEQHYVISDMKRGGNPSKGAAF